MKKHIKALAKEIMTKEVLTAFPETSLLEASDKMIRKTYHGLPVIDRNGRVLGIVTQYDLVSKGTRLHLPTFMKLFDSFSKSDQSMVGIHASVVDALSFVVRDVMNPDPLLVEENSPIEDIVKILSEHHRVDPLPVVDSQKFLKGIISRFDIIKFYADVLRKAKRMNKK